jgi:hypothetical protein
MKRHRAACVEEAVNRRTGRTPSLDEYPSLRRRSLGRFLFDLFEPVLGIEVPAAVVSTAPWQSLMEKLTDLAAWCNDVASHTVEAARDDPHNYVTVIAAAAGLDPVRAASRVIDRIAGRANEIAAAARALPADLTALGVPAGSVRQADEVAAVLVRAQGAQLQWLQESDRYGPGGPASGATASVAPGGDDPIGGGSIGGCSIGGDPGAAVPRARGQWRAREAPAER